MANLALNQKFNRRNFLPTFFNETEGVEEIALNESMWGRLFQVKYPTTTHALTSGELQRPDLVSLNAYQRADYWWIICKFNNIMDPFTELSETGLILNIPDIKDVQDYYMNVKNRRRVSGGTGTKTSSSR